MTNLQIQESAKLTHNQNRLNDNEKKMKAGLFEFSKGLRDIRDSKCWHIRGNPYSSFDDYCRKNFGFGERQGNYLIAADDFKKLMLESGGTEKELDDLKETHVRPLLEAKVTPEKALEVLREIKEEAPKVTADVIRKKLNLASSKKPKPIEAEVTPIHKCPHCGHEL